MTSELRFRILVAEDDTDTREGLAAVLELVGWDVLQAASPDEAMRQLDDHRVDLLLTDLFGVDPDSAAESVRDLVARAHPVPVIVLTGWPLPRSKLPSEIRFVTRKPFDASELIAEVARALDQRPSGDDPRVASVFTYFQALTGKDWPLLGSVVSDGVVYELPGDSRHAARVVGREPFLAFSEKVFREFADAVFDEVRVYELPRGLAARYQARWTLANGTATGQSGAALFEFEGARIAHVGVEVDAERLSQKAPGAA